MDTFQFHAPTRVVFGAGIVGELASELESYGACRAMLVTEKYLLKIGLATKVQKALEGSPIQIASVFDGVVPNSEVQVVEQGAATARENGVELIIALGGGSTMDTAKGIDILLSHGGKLLDYQGVQLLPGPVRPMIAIPTTAGTGSEVTNVAVILDAQSHSKIPFVDNYLIPAVALLDPSLTTSLPARVTAATGMDALTHAIESFVAMGATPMTEALSLSAAAAITRWLPRAVEDGADLEARGRMLVASCMAGTAFSAAGVGCVHGMAHALGGLCGVVHGEGNSIMLPYGMEYNLETVPDRFAELARAMRVAGPSQSDADAARAAIAKVRELRALMREKAALPETLARVGVDRGKLGEVATLACQDGSMFYNRRSVVEEEILGLLQQAYA